ncbi:hypothetical protein ACUY2L_11795, partial [Corynebacterium mastitidis]
DTPVPAAPQAAEAATIPEPALRALLSLLPALPSSGMHRAAILAPEHEDGPRLLLSREDAHAATALDKAVGALLLQRRVPATGLHLALSSPPTAAAVEHARARRLLLARAGGAPKRRPVALYSGALSGGA